MSKLIAGATHEIIKRVLGVELSGAIPIEPLLLGGTDHGALRGRGGFVSCFSGPDGFAVAAVGLVGYKLDILELQAKVVDRLADQVTVSLADMAELRVRHSHKQDMALRMIEAGGLEPGFIGSAIDFFFQCVKNSHPRIGSGGTKERHKKLSRGSKNASQVNRC